ncbi:MAG: prepilin peptidase [Pseudomonadota bacterium]
MIALLAIASFPAALIIAAMNDIYEFKIPNYVPVLLGAGFLVTSLALRADARIVLDCLMIATAALVVGFGLFARRIIGAGDAKLFAATMLWVGSSAIIPFLFNIAIGSVILTLSLLVFRKAPAFPVYAQAPWLLRLHQEPKDIPYAVAICIAGLLTFPELVFFRLAFIG